MGVIGFSDCGLCDGTGLVENLATGASERCSRCAQRAFGAERPADPPASSRSATSADPWLLERAAFALKAGLWASLIAGGAVLFYFTRPKEDGHVPNVSNELESLERDSSDKDEPSEYSRWEPEQ